MNLSVYRMTLDIRDMDSQLSFSVKQNDTMRRLIISLTDHCKPYSLPEGCYAVFTAKTSKKTVVSEGCQIKDNKIIYDISGLATATVGVSECDISIFGAEGETIATPHITMNVFASVLSEFVEEVVGSPEYDTLVSLIGEANTAISQCNSAASGANTAKDNANELVSDINKSLDKGAFNGQDGVTFMPSISEDGILSWTNDKGLVNPEPVKVIGPQGPQGNQKGESMPDYTTLVNTLNSSDNMAYEQGLSIYILALNVPDIWIASVENESVHYTYTSDEDLVEDLKNGTVQVGYYKLAPLETQKVEMTDYVKKANFLVGSGEPTQKIVAPFVGALYLDSENNKTYQCTAITSEDGTTTYTWVKLIRETDIATTQKLGLVKQHPTSDAYSGVFIKQNGELYLTGADKALPNAYFESPRDYNVAVLSKDLYRWIKVGLVQNDQTWTDSDRDKARKLLGIPTRIKKFLLGCNLKLLITNVSDGTYTATIYDSVSVGDYLITADNAYLQIATVTANSLQDPSDDYIKPSPNAVTTTTTYTITFTVPSGDFTAVANDFFYVAHSNGTKILSAYYTASELEALSEEWTFTLDDDTTVTKKVLVLPDTEA